MADTLASIVKEAKRNRYSLTKSLSEDDIIYIWEGASEFVEKQMFMQKGVAVPGLGVFTFSQKKIDVGSNKFIVIQRPAFVLSEKLAQTHSLHVTKQHTTGQVPIVPLNFTVLSNDSPFNRDTVEMSIKDILLALSRSLATKKGVQLDFGKVGRLLIAPEGKVKMIFFREFINGLDNSGGMESAFRPGTTNSVLSIMSNPGTPRPTTTSLVLPRIVEPFGENALNLECTPRPASVGRPCTPRHTFDKSPFTDEAPAVAESTDAPTQKGRDSVLCVETEKLTPLRTPCSGKHSLVPKPAMLFTTKDQPGSKLSQSCPESQLASVKWRPSSSGSSSCKSTASKSVRGNEEARSTMSSTPQFAVRPSTCSHSSPSGQELCYLCHQRAQKNVPIDVSEERREREKVDDQMLQDYQYQKDLIALAKEFSTKSKNRSYNKEIASLNLEVAQAHKVIKTAKTSEFHPSYVFTQRESTPAKHLKQSEYCSQLDSQVHRMKNQRQMVQELEENLEREEQNKLSEELAMYQKEYSQQKSDKVLQYQRALAEQVAIKHELSSIWSRNSNAGNISLPNAHNITNGAISASLLKPTSPDMLASGGSSSAKLGPLKLRPLSLPKPTIILPFTHSKPMTVLKDRNMKMLSLKPAHLLSVDNSNHGPTKHLQQPVFGVHDHSSDKMKEQKERSRKLFMEQLKMAATKQHMTQEKAMLEQQEEAEMLKQTRNGLIDDIRADKCHKLETRKSLERSWNNNIKEKDQRELEELNHSKQPSLLVHQQCDRYVRCKQCQRSRHNKGQSNLMCETRYISGSRLMV